MSPDAPETIERPATAPSVGGDGGLRLVYVAREKPLPGRAPPLQIFHTLRGLCRTGPGVTYLSPWPEELLRRRFVELTAHPVPDNLTIRSLGPGPSIPWLAQRWPALWWSAFRRRLRKALVAMKRADPGVVVYTRNRNVVSDLHGPDLPPMVFECHEFRSRSAAEIRGLDANDPAIAAIRDEERRALSQVSAMATLTQCLADDYRAAFPGLDIPIGVVPDGVDPALFAIAPADRAPQANRFIYVGSLISWKGLDTALRALAKAPGTELHICGGQRDSGDWNALLRLGAELGVSDRLTLHGTLPQSELRPLLAGAVAGILPLNGEFSIAARYTSPLKLFEYLAAGLPVLATDLPSIREVVTHGEQGLLFADRDADALAAAMRQISGDAALADRLSRAAAETAGRYSWEDRARRIWSLCGTALERHRQATHQQGMESTT